MRELGLEWIEHAVGVVEKELDLMEDLLADSQAFTPAVTGFAAAGEMKADDKCSVAKVKSLARTTPLPTGLFAESRGGGGGSEGVLLSTVEVAAAKKIQVAWRRSRQAHDFTRSGFCTYSLWRGVTGQDVAVSREMLGRTVAMPADDRRFALRHPDEWGKGGYHRVMPIETDGSDGPLRGVLQACGWPIRKGEILLPIRKSAQLDVRKLIADYLPGEKLTRIYEDEQLLLYAIVVKEGSESQIEAFLAQGIQASHWQLAHAQHRLTRQAIAAVSVEKVGEPGYTKKEVLLSEAFLRLSRLALRLDLATQSLAAAAVHLLESLPEDFFSAQRQALWQLIDITVANKVDNYVAFATCIAALLHEVALYTQQNLCAKKEVLVSLPLHQMAKRQAYLEAMNMPEDSAAIETLCLPAFSGCFARRLACSLLNESAGHDKALSSEELGVRYYEFDLSKEDWRGVSAGELPDVLDVTLGSVCTGSAVSDPWVLDDLVCNGLLRFTRVLPKHVTLLVDVTSADMSRLRLSPRVHELIASGRLSFVFYQSLQKFGLLHSDQVQVGEVFICSAQKSLVEHFSSWQERAGVDYRESIDMQVEAFLFQHARLQMAKVRANHFVHGALLQHSLWALFDGIYPMHAHHELSPLFELVRFPAGFQQETLAMRHAISLQTMVRQSFGHAAISSSPLCDKQRLAAGGGHPIDTLLQTVAIFFAYQSRLPVEAARRSCQSFNLSLWMAGAAAPYQAKARINWSDYLRRLANVDVKSLALAQQVVMLAFLSVYVRDMKIARFDRNFYDFLPAWQLIRQVTQMDRRLRGSDMAQHLFNCAQDLLRQWRRSCHLPADKQLLLERQLLVDEKNLWANALAMVWRAGDESQRSACLQALLEVPEAVQAFAVLYRYAEQVRVPGESRAALLCTRHWFSEMVSEKDVAKLAAYFAKALQDWARSPGGAVRYGRARVALALAQKEQCLTSLTLGDAEKTELTCTSLAK